MRITKIHLSHIISVFILSFLSLDMHAEALMMSPENHWLPALNANVKQFVFEFEKSTHLSLNLPQGKIISDQVDFVGRFSMTSLASGAQGFDLAFIIENAEVLAKNVQIHLSMTQDLGFGSATINLNVQCAAISIRAKKTQPMQAVLDRQFAVQAFRLNLSKDDIETNLIGCNSITGLDGAVQAKAIEFIQAQVVNAELHKALNVEISQQLNKKLSEFGRALPILENTMSLKAQVDTENRLWIMAEEAAEGERFTPTEIEMASSSAKPVILIKKTYIEKMLLKYLNFEFEKEPIFSKFNSGLQKLTCSRWSQFFAWPSLMALPKCFNMEMRSKLQDVKLIDPAQMRFSLTLQSWSKAVDQNKDIAYFSAGATISLIDMAADVKTLSGRHYPEFISWSGKSSRISMSLIKSALQDFVNVKLGEMQKNEKQAAKISIFNFKKSKIISPDTLMLQLN